MRRTNQHVILSHGGKHGVQARTLLRGQVVSAAAAPHVPEKMIDARPANPGDQASTQARAEKVVQTSAKKALAEGSATTVEVKAASVVPSVAPPKKAKKAEKPKKAQAPDPAPSEAASEPQASESDAATEMGAEPETAPEPESDAVSVPGSKRALSRLNKTNSYRLAKDLALDVPSDPTSITLKKLHRMLAEELGL